MTSAWLLCDLATIYKPDTKRGLNRHFMFCMHQYLQTLSGILGVTKGFHQWRHRVCQVTLVEITDQVQNEDQSWYLRFHVHHYLQTLLDMLRWQQNFISDIFMVLTWLWSNFWTMCKMRSRCISQTLHTPLSSNFIR